MPRTVARHWSKVENRQLVMPLRSAYWAHQGYQARAALGRTSPISATAAASTSSIIRIVISLGSELARRV